MNKEIEIREGQLWKRRYDGLSVRILRRGNSVWVTDHDADVRKPEVILRDHYDLVDGAACIEPNSGITWLQISEGFPDGIEIMVSLNAPQIQKIISEAAEKFVSGCGVKEIQWIQAEVSKSGEPTLKVHVIMGKKDD